MRNLGLFKDKPRMLREIGVFHPHFESADVSTGILQLGQS